MRGRKLSARLGWVAIVGTLLFFQGRAFLFSLRHTLKGDRANGDSLQQIFPFFQYLTPNAFENDYISDYYLACYPVGYRALYVLSAGLGIDPVSLSQYLPHVLWVTTVICVGAVAHRLGGKFAAFAAMAFVLGSNVYLSRIAGGLPRGFGFPILALTMLGLVSARVWLCALCVLLGTMFYPVAGVISGLSLACMLLLPNAAGLSARSWSLSRRLLVLVATSVLAVMLLLPAAIASSRFGSVVRPTETGEFPEAGIGGRYTKDSRPPFDEFFDDARVKFERSLIGAKPVWSKPARDWLIPGADRQHSDRFYFVTRGLLFLIVIGVGAMLVRRPAARRVLLLGVASYVGHELSCVVAPYAYLPERYVVYSIPLLTSVAAPVCIAGLFSRRFDRGWQRWLKTAVVAAHVTVLLTFFGGRVSANVGLDVVLRRKKAPLIDTIAALPRNSLIAGWPKGIINEVPYSSRRRVLLSYEVHQAFHKDFTLEMRRRMRGLIDAYFATSVRPLTRLRDEFGVTHLIIQRSHFDDNPPRYFKPFDRFIAESRGAARGKSFEVLKQIESAGVLSYRDWVLLDLGRIGPSVRPKPKSR